MKLTQWQLRLQPPSDFNGRNKLKRCAAGLDLPALNKLNE